MGDLKSGEAFTDIVFITDSDGKAATGLSPTCYSLKVSDGTRTSLIATEVGNGWYKAAFTPDADGIWGTEWAVAGSYTINGAFKILKVGGGQVSDIYGKVDTEVGAIKTVTDALPDGGALTTIQADLDNPDQYKADVTNLDATISSRAPSGEYDTQLGASERASATALATAQTDLDNPAQYKADVSDLPTNAEAEALIENAAATRGTHNITTANDKTETTVFEVSKTGLYTLAWFLDLDTLKAADEGGIITVRLYKKVDASTYPDLPFIDVDYVVGTSDEYPSGFSPLISHNVKLTIQCSSDVTATRNIAYEYTVRDLGA